jgi:hypothetical protein
MSQPYPVLTYRADISDLPSGILFGWDETFRPYETIDAQFYPTGEECGTSEHEGTGAHSHLFLQYARPETVKAQIEPFTSVMRMRGLLP